MCINLSLVCYTHCNSLNDIFHSTYTRDYTLICCLQWFVNTFCVLCYYSYSHDAPKSPVYRKQRIPSRNNPPPMMSQWLSTFQVHSKFTALNRTEYSIVHCVQKKKTPTHIFFHISMCDKYIQTKIAANIPKER